MANIKFTPKALNDLVEIKAYIAEELGSEISAANTVGKITKKIRMLSDFPEIDFEKEMLIVYCYRTVYGRKQVLENVFSDGNLLYVEFNVVKGKIGHADASAPSRRMLVVKLDRLDITEVKITYNGQ